MKEYTNLGNIRQINGNLVNCNKCGNTLQIVDNGLFNGQLFFCADCEKVFNIQIKDITNKANYEFIEQCKIDDRIKKAKSKINLKNINDIEDLLYK